MILYFSGTGNSRHLAEKLSSLTGDKAISLAAKLRETPVRAVSAAKPLVFVCPVHYGRIPRAVEDCIRKIPFQGNHDAYFVVTCSDSPQKAEKYVLKLCADKNFRFRGFASVRMPENNIIDGETCSKEEADALIAKADETAETLARQIVQGSMLRYEPPQKGSGSLFNRLLSAKIKPQLFSATDRCTGCAECVRRCPTQNIELSDGKPRWGTDCTHCLACLNGCPNAAVEYGGKTQGKQRYFLP